MTDKLPEVWLRGPLPGVPSVLQPVGHALLQAREEVEAIMQDFPEQKPVEPPGRRRVRRFPLAAFLGRVEPAVHVRAG